MFGTDGFYLLRLFGKQKSETFKKDEMQAFLLL